MLVLCTNNRSRINLHQPQAVAIMADAAGDGAAGARARWRLGEALGEAGRWAEAAGPLASALAALEAAPEPDHADVAQVCNGERLASCM